MSVDGYRIDERPSIKGKACLALFLNIIKDVYRNTLGAC